MKHWLIALAVLVTCASPVLAQADTFILLDTPNDTISAFDDPYALVTIHLVDGFNAQISFNTAIVNTLTPGDGVDYLMGAQGAVGVNVNADTFTVSNITGTNSNLGFTPGPYTFAGAGNEDGFGSFNATIDADDGYTSTADVITFDILNTTLTPWASSATVLEANASNEFAAAHIFVTDNPANPENGALATGYAAGNIEVGINPLQPPVPVPEPATLLLFGSGLVGMGAAFKRKLQWS